MKYGLIYGDIDDFIGEIPAKNRKEILAFKVDDEDKMFKYAYMLGDGSPNIARYRQMKIVAGIKDFDTSNRVIVNRELRHIPDPIVLQPVNGGFLIVSKWGDEENVV